MISPRAKIVIIGPFIHLRLVRIYTSISPATMVLSVYINETLIYGDDFVCHEAGCTGDVPWVCSPLETWTPLDITDDLDPGENVIAVHVSNLDEAGSGSYFWLSLNVEQLSFNLPFVYSGRDTKLRELYFAALQSQMISVFDHSAAGDDQLQTFLGSSYDNPDGRSDCQEESTAMMAA